MKSTIKLFVITLFVAIIGACNSDYPGYDRTETGLLYRFHIQNEDAPKPREGDVITVNMIYRHGDSILFDSRMMNSDFRFPLDPPSFKGDIFEGLAMMGIGDSATFIIPADSLKRFGNLPPLDSGTMLYFDVKLLDIMSEADFEKEKVLMAAEEKRQLEQLRIKEEKEIARYIEKENIKVNPTQIGMYFILEKAGTGQKATRGKVVEIHYTAWYLDGGKLFSSHDDSGESIMFVLGKEFEVPAIEEALLMMRTGSSVRLVVPSELAYGELGIRDMVAPCTPLVFELNLISLMEQSAYVSMMTSKEKQQMEKYLADNAIKASPDKNGIYYIELRKGDGPMAVAGKICTVHYIGRTMDGKVFDSSYDRGTPLQFRVGSGDVITGWEIGILNMNAGGKAKLIIPSAMAYGDSYSGFIPPYSPLIFEIDLLSVR